ncbi:ribonuclease III [Nitrosomonas aestuarii]|uniref:ribonuclease III n=1 Tax=Nitrosomonas aestuarii TaxID=52441 RepID=UPI000D31D2D0|nr:ribonuclease III [Nitrosomonas aestuarii]PTN12649.1 RNAse III [Nitrosomonas aestuarii]
MQNNREAILDSFCSRLGYQFVRAELLGEALTHRSHSLKHNERLEFLGDSVLNCAIAGLIFRKFIEVPEGRLSRLRASMVNQTALSDLALYLKMDELIRLGEGELKSGGNRRPSILADALEAVFGAIYVDSNFVQAEAVITKLYTPILDTIDHSTHGKDPKTMLQELLQSQKLDLPEYIVVTTIGKAHQQKFKVECVIPKFNIRTAGEGFSRRSAEQAAAKKAYELACVDG